MKLVATEGRFLVALAVSLVTQGCHPAALDRVAGSNGAGGQVENRTAEPRPVIDNLYGIEGLRAACLKTNGAFWVDRLQECFCTFKGGEAPRVFSALDSSCRPLSYKQFGKQKKAAAGAYMNGWIPELNKELSGLVKGQRTSLGIELSEDLTAKEALHVARYIDGYLPQTLANLWATSEDIYFNSSIKILVGRTQVGQEFIRQAVEAPPMFSQQPYKLTLIEPDVAALLHSLGHPNSQVVALAPLPESVRNEFAAAHATESAIQSFITNNGQIRSRIGGDCRRYCVVEKGLSEIGGAYAAIHEKWYLNGVPFRNLIKVSRQLSSEPEATVQLGLSGSVSAILFIKRTFDSKSDAIATHVRVYDRLWRSIGNESIEVVTQLTRRLDQIFQIPTIERQMRNGVVLCEGLDLEALEGSNLEKALRRRPAILDLESGRGSLFGWFANPIGEFRRLLDPMEFNGVFAVPDAGMHGYRVGNVLISANPEVGVVPITAPNCIAQYRHWAPIVQRYAVKVVNLSATEPMDRRWCEEFNQTKDFLGHEMPFLWVTAAGNSGLENPSLRCPQSMGPQENLIVVAGGNSGGLWHQSDYGNSFADVVADVHNSISADLGTSYSAARASALAAKIASLYPDLAPRDLRRAILFGAGIPYAPLAVRSGGAIDENGALEVAAQLAALSELERKNLTTDGIQTILETFVNKTEAARRLQIWKERDLI